MARPVRVSILADPKDFVAGMKQAQTSAETAETALTSAEKVFATFDSTMDKVSGTADFLGGEMGRVGAGLSGVGDRLAEMNPEWAGLGGALTEAGKNLTLVSDAMDVVTGVANTAQAAVGLLKNTQLGQTIATQAAAAVQWLWNAALSANPIGIVVIAIAALVAGLIWFFTQTEVGQQAWESFMGGLTSLWETFVAFITVVWDGLVAGFTWVADQTRVVWEPVAAFFTTLIEGIQGAWDTFISWLWPSGKTGAENFKGGVDSGDVDGHAKEVGTDAAKGFDKGLGSQNSEIRKTAESWRKEVEDGVKQNSQALNWNKTLGKWITDGVFQGMTAEIDRETRIWASKMKGSMSRHMSISSPSKVMRDEVGTWLGRGIWDGINSVTDSEMAKYGRSLTSGMSGLVAETDLSLSLAEQALNNGGTVIVVGDIEVQASNSREASVIEAFASMLQRKTKAGV